jgi:glycerol-3-phosphate acyltransferase PlsY
MMILARMAALAIGYICGMFLSGYFIGKSKDVDIRTQGSGNVGTTNTMRILGVRMGAITLLGDCLKSVVAVLVVWLLFHRSLGDHVRLLELYGAVGAVLGHDFPVYMHFKGGKGIAASFGMLLAVFPTLLPAAIVVFAVAVGLTKYVSLGSILACLVVVIEVYAFGAFGWLDAWGSDLIEAQILLTLAAILAVFLHRSNIKRLYAGTENRLSFKSRRD